MTEDVVESLARYIESLLCDIDDAVHIAFTAASRIATKSHTQFYRKRIQHGCRKRSRIHLRY